jgi:hypothetical protein
LIGVSCSLEDSEAGKGLIVLGPNTRASLEEYMGRNAPLYFLVTEDGRGSYYMYCEGGFNCDRPAARRQALDQCRSRAGRDCKIYAIRRVVVWQDALGDSARTGPQLTAGEQLTRDCLAGPTPADRIGKCSQAITSSELAEEAKRGPYYVRARAYEEVGDSTGAEQDYRAVLSIDPQHPGANAGLARLVPTGMAPGSTRP